jgi:hypothetical protein
MSLGKKAAVGAVAIAVVFGLALLLLDRLTADPGGPRATTAGAPFKPPPLEPPLAPLAPPPTAQPAQPLQPLDPAAPAAPAPARVGGRELLSSIAEARTRVLDCAGLTEDPSEQSPRARQAAARVNAGKPRTVLLLELERLDGLVRVRSAQVQSRGAGAEDLIRCAQQLVVGQLLEAASSRAGGDPLKMQFALDR